MPERPEFSRLLTVLTFYILSCGCLSRPSPSTPPTHPTLWREEIESGPSLLRTSDRIASTGTSWMKLPPPSVERVREVNRRINGAREGWAAGVGEREENLLDEIGGGRRRWREGVLGDMEGGVERPGRVLRRGGRGSLYGYT